MQRTVLYLFLPLWVCALVSCGVTDTKRESKAADYLSDEQSTTLYQESYEGFSLEKLTQQYFTEMFIYRGYNTSTAAGESGGTARLLHDPLFWIKQSEETDGSLMFQAVIEDGLKRLTNDTIKASFVLSTTQPETTQPLFTVEFADGLESAGVATYNEQKTGEITGGTLGFAKTLFQAIVTSSDITSFRTVVRHELGHILAGTLHSGMIMNIMSYNKAVNTAYNFQEYEEKAFQLLYSLEAGTTLKSLQDSGKISAENLVVAPRILIARNMTTLSKPYNTGSVGETISLGGERLNFAWGCSDYQFEWPTITFNGVAGYVTAFNRTRASEGGSHNCVIFNAVIPRGATTGPLVVTAYGKTSNSFNFTVMP